MAINLGLCIFVTTAVALTIPLPGAQNISSSVYDRHTLCDQEMYGSPNEEDCRGLLIDFLDENDQIQRVFDQEEVRKNQDGSYPGLQFYVKQAALPNVIQLPQFVSRKSCNIAMLPYASTSEPLRGWDTATIANTHWRGITLIENCISKENKASGGVTLVSSADPARLVELDEFAISLFMWETGAGWESVLNSVTNDPIGVLPTGIGLSQDHPVSPGRVSNSTVIGSNPT